LLRGIQSLGAGVDAVLNRVASVKLELVIYGL